MSRRRSGRRNTGARRIRKAALCVLLFAVLIATVGLVLGIAHLRPDFGEGEIGFCLQEDGLEISWPTLSQDSVCRLYLYDTVQEKYALVGEFEENDILLSGMEAGKNYRFKFQAARRMEDPFGKIHELKGETRKVEMAPQILDSPVLTQTADPDADKVAITWQKNAGESYEIYLQDEKQEWRLYTTTAEGWFELTFGEGLKLPDRDAPIMVKVRACQPQDNYVLHSELSQEAAVERRELMPDRVTLNWEKIGECRYRLYWEESRGDLYELQQWTDSTSSWRTLTICAWNEPLEYETDRVVSNSEVKFRVITYDSEEEWEKGKLAASPGEVSFWTDLSTLYCTIWPIVDLELYENSDSQNVLSKIDAGAALCVLGEENGRFEVRYKDEFGYVDSRYCMINLPEYIGNLCSYDITNSYSSIFRVHEYDIPGLTGNVIKGYEGIQLEDSTFVVPYLYPCAQKLRLAAESCREDGYRLRIYDAFRPNEATRYLYDTATTLLELPVPQIRELDGSEQAEELKQNETDVQNPENQEGADGDIYGGLVPEALAALQRMQPEELGAIGLTQSTVSAVCMLSPEALVSLKNMTQDTLALLVAEISTLPPEAFSGTAATVEVPDDTDDSADGGAVQENMVDSESQELSAQVNPAYAAVVFEAIGAASLGMSVEDLMVCVSLPTDQLTALKAYLEGSVKTYYKVMTDDRYRLGSFLAAVTSAHNRGIALDLTLEKTDTGEILDMQSSMHDLSWYSALPQNNENAELLAGYMKAAGFKDLTSEWWHFQDDETREEIALNSYLAKGVSIEGWKKDDNGWRYRLEDGSYYQNTEVQIDQVSYSFDAEGYCTE